MSSAEAASTTGAASPRGAVKGAPRKRRTQAERSDETQQRVIEAAAKVLRKKGYAGLRTDEVSRVAKVSRGAQQYHFPTKDALVLATAAYLLRSAFERGQSRAATRIASDEPVEALIQDSIDFFLGPDFSVILDLVLASTKERGLRDEVLGHTRTNRLALEQTWVEVFEERGIERARAQKIVMLTTSIVRGFAVRALWQNDEALFRDLLDEWKTILGSHLNTISKERKST
tara:strand:- start:3254 stop:3943 length:690 start_codon:yes stop_codon:yes gene_type:complete